MPESRLYPRLMSRDSVTAQVRRMTAAGMSGREIARTIDIAPSTVFRMRKEAEVTGRVNRPWQDDELRRAEAHLEDGCSLSEVARTLGRPLSSVRKKFPGRRWTHQQVNDHNRAAREFGDLKHTGFQFRQFEKQS